MPPQEVSDEVYRRVHELGTETPCAYQSLVPASVDAMERILFINGSPNRDGNTADLAGVLLEGRTYETLQLTDYRLNLYGQTLAGDCFDEVLEKINRADIVVVSSPVYWHNLCSSVRALMERFYGVVPAKAYEGKRLFFIYQGEAPTKMMIETGEYTLKRFAAIYGFTYEGMATCREEASALRPLLQ